MAKKFIDINNLKVIWDEINKRFVRNSRFVNEMEITNPIYFRCSYNTRLHTPRLAKSCTWQIEKDYYDNFIIFANSSNLRAYVEDENDMLWEVVNKAFYSKKYSEIPQFNGVILSANDEPINDQNVVNFWYLRAEKIVNPDSVDDITYQLTWGEWIGDMDGYVTYEDLNGALKETHVIKNFNNRLKTIEAKLQIEGVIDPLDPNSPAEEGNEYNYFTLSVVEQGTDKIIAGVDISNANSTEYLDDVETMNIPIEIYDTTTGEVIKDCECICQCDHDCCCKMNIDAEGSETTGGTETVDLIGHVGSNNIIRLNMNKDIEPGTYVFRYEDENGNIIDNFDKIAEITYE